MSNVDKAYLKLIVDATAKNENAYVGQVVGQPMIAAGLIEINADVTNPADPTQVLCRSTPAAIAYLKSDAGSNEVDAAKPSYAILTNVVLPEAKKRGNTSGSGAPTKYPFADLPVNGTFFSADTEHKNGNAYKSLGSTVSAQNDKYSEQKMVDGVGVTKTVTRAVRDKTTKKAQIGPDGKKVTETVELPVKVYSRKFTIRAVEGGKDYGAWKAPADGALVARTQ